ncbi:MAG: diguanylate cyclase, partial [Methylococcales bacterium]
GLSAVTEKIRIQLAEPYDLDGKIIVSTASIGSALYRTDEQSIGDLIKEADAAMYRDKMHKRDHKPIANQTYI